MAGEPAGLARGADGPAGRRHLHSMWVHPDHRGARVGAALVAAVRAWAEADGADELVLWVVDGNAAAARLYAREGFVPTGVREPVAGRAGVEQEQWALRLRPAGP